MGLVDYGPNHRLMIEDENFTRVFNPYQLSERPIEEMYLFTA